MENLSKFFVDLKLEFEYLDFILAILARLNPGVTAYVPSLSTAIIEKFRSGSSGFSEHPLSLTEVYKKTDFAICHTGSGNNQRV